VQRRSFLKEASLAVAGGAGLVTGGDLAAAQRASVAADLPQQKFLNEKTKRILGFAPRDDMTVCYRQ
jgi:hypothetical protein